MRAFYAKGLPRLKCTWYLSESKFFRSTLDRDLLKMAALVTFIINNYSIIIFCAANVNLQVLKRRSTDLKQKKKKLFSKAQVMVGF